MRMRMRWVVASGGVGLVLGSALSLGTGARRGPPCGRAGATHYSTVRRARRAEAGSAGRGVTRLPAIRFPPRARTCRPAPIRRRLRPRRSGARPLAPEDMHGPSRGAPAPRLPPARRSSIISAPLRADRARQRDRRRGARRRRRHHHPGRGIRPQLPPARVVAVVSPAGGWGPIHPPPGSRERSDMWAASTTRPDPASAA
eukprot:scaffold569_cov408-Prasinococcus_capsulatus_cf.AAC.36